MFARLLEPPTGSCLLLGPRGTGKSTWIGQRLPDALVLDLLDYATYTELLTHPNRLEQIVAATSAATVVIDEVQRAPILLDEVHRLIEQRGTRFVLTGSSAQASSGRCEPARRAGTDHGDASAHRRRART